MEVVPTVMKQVRIGHRLIDLEEKLEHTSCLLEEVHDEAVAVLEQVWAVDACLWDLDGWVCDLRKRV